MIDDVMKRASHLAAVPFLGSIMVFGGDGIGDATVSRFNEEGELVRHSSTLALIPRFMCWRAYTVQKRKIYAVTKRWTDQKCQMGVSAFDGSEWVRI